MYDNDPPHGNELSSNLQSKHVVMIALGGVIGAGFFVGSSTAIAQAGPIVLLAYAVAGILVFFVNVMMKDLALYFPGKQSFLGHIELTLGGRAAFLAAWSYWLIWVTVVAIEAIAMANILSVFIDFPKTPIELTFIFIITVMNCLSVENYGFLEYVLSFIKIAAILLFLIICMGYVCNDFSIVKKNLLVSQGIAPNGWISMVCAIPTIVFSMGGSEIATIAAVESGEDRKSISNSIKSVALRIGGLYLTSIVFIIICIPWTSIKSGHSPFLEVLKQIGIPYAQILMACVIFIAALSALNSGVYVTSRVLHNLAVSGNSLKYFEKTSDKNKIPLRALIFSSLTSSIILLSSFFSYSEIFSVLMRATGIFTIFNYFLIALAARKIKNNNYYAYFSIFLLCSILFFMSLVEDMRGDILIGLIAYSIILFMLFIKERVVTANNIRRS
ncbi:amino acid permease [Acetobacter senegalensis]|nr:amino acid permease [Acetobacter senegalensis]